MNVAASALPACLPPATNRDAARAWLGRLGVGTREFERCGLGVIETVTLGVRECLGALRERARGCGFLDLRDCSSFTILSCQLDEK